MTADADSQTCRYSGNISNIYVIRRADIRVMSAIYEKYASIHVTCVSGLKLLVGGLALRVYTYAG